MIKWLCTWPFLKEIYRQGGIDSFKLAHAYIMRTMQDDLDKKAEELSQGKLNNLLSIVDDKKIITFSASMKAIFIGGERADESRLMNLKSEAEAILAMDLWNILYETPKELAHRAMFIAGDDIDSMKKGRSILYTLDTQKKILDTLKSYQPNKPIAP